MHRLFHLGQPRVQLEHAAILPFEEIDVEHGVEDPVDELAVQERPLYGQADPVGVLHGEPRRQEEELPRRSDEQHLPGPVGLVGDGIALQHTHPIVFEVGLLTRPLFGLQRFEGRLFQVLELQRHRVGADELLVRRQGRVDLHHSPVVVQHQADLLVRHGVRRPLQPADDARADLFQLLQHLHGGVVRQGQRFGFDLAHFRRREQVGVREAVDFGVRTFGDGAVHRPARELVGVHQPRAVEVPVLFPDRRPLPSQGLNLVLLHFDLFREREPHAVIVVDDARRLRLFHERGGFRKLLVGAVRLHRHEPFDLHAAIVDVDPQHDLVFLFALEPYGGERPDDLDVLVPLHRVRPAVARLQLLAHRRFQVRFQKRQHFICVVEVNLCSYFRGRKSR